MMLARKDVQVIVWYLENLSGFCLNWELGLYLCQVLRGLCFQALHWCYCGLIFTRGHLFINFSINSMKSQTKFSGEIVKKGLQDKWGFHSSFTAPHLPGCCAWQVPLLWMHGPAWQRWEEEIRSITWRKKTQGFILLFNNMLLNKTNAKPGKKKASTVKFLLFSPNCKQV